MNGGGYGASTSAIDADLVISDRDGRGGVILCERAALGSDAARAELIHRADTMVPGGGSDWRDAWETLCGAALWAAVRAGYGSAGLELERRASAYGRTLSGDTVSA